MLGSTAKYIQKHTQYSTTADSRPSQLLEAQGGMPREDYKLYFVPEYILRTRGKQYIYDSTILNCGSKSSPPSHSMFLTLYSAVITPETNIMPTSPELVPRNRLASRPLTGLVVCDGNELSRASLTGCINRKRSLGLAKRTRFGRK